MTNPKHTDTSRSGDLVKLKAMLAKCNDSGHDWWLFTLAAERDVPVLIDRIEALEAENERLREAVGILEDGLQEVGDDYPGSSCQEWCQHQIKQARAALKEISNGDR